MTIKCEQDLTSEECSIWFKAMNALQIGNTGYTIQLIQILLKAHPGFLKGRQLLRKAAIMQLPAQRGIAIKFLYTLFFLIQIQSKKKSFAILEMLEKWLEHDPYNKHANWLLHHTAISCDMPETAAFALETLLEGHPQDIPGMRKLADHYIQQNQPQKALSIYNRILELVPVDFLAMQGRKNATAQVSMQGGGWNKVGTTYRELMKNS